VKTVKMPRMSKSEVDKLINEQFLCRIAFRGRKQTYIAPFQYAVVNGKLYFHFTEYGKKMSFFKEESPVCVEIERYTSDFSEYEFVVLNGKLRLVEDFQEKKLAIEKMAEVGKKRLSSNFLAAHGFPKRSEWSSFTVDKPMFIVRLEYTTDAAGLKSP